MGLAGGVRGAAAFAFAALVVAFLAGDFVDVEGDLVVAEVAFALLAGVFGGAWAGAGLAAFADIFEKKWVIWLVGAVAEAFSCSMVAFCCFLPAAAAFVSLASSFCTF